MAAYFRSANDGWAILDQPSNDSWIERHGDRYFVVLRNAKGVLAVYKIRPSDHTLRRMRRWPKSIA